jgi:hypothetical protein
MTRRTQKREERAVVGQYLQLRGLTGQLVEGEHPDFTLHTANEVIGLEVTAYHGQTGNVSGQRARQVESSWDALREYSGGFRERHTEFNSLNVRLNFKERRLPPPSRFEAFCCAVADILRRNMNAFSRTYTDLRVEPNADALLDEYLSHITVSVTKAYLDWDWPAYMSGGIGTSDDELLAVVDKKLRTYRAPPAIRTSHLIIYGGGPGLSRIAAPFSAEQLEAFTKLNAALRAGPFAVVAILDLRDFVWTRGAGWQQLGEGRA